MPLAKTPAAATAAEVRPTGMSLVKVEAEAAVAAAAPVDEAGMPLMKSLAAATTASEALSTGTHLVRRRWRLLFLL
jgi:hypothetical protein